MQLYQPEQAQQANSLAAVESQRAMQEVQAALVIAKKFPRNVRACIDRILNACTRPVLAEQAVYEFARGGQNITGPSIRLAETVAQHWGNLDFGFHELYRGTGEDGVTYSEVRAFAWDMETNTRRQMQFRVRHWRDTKSGGYKLNDERDIYELVANQAQRRVRACITAIVPGDVFEEAVNQCEATQRADAKNDKESVQKMLSAFEKLGVTRPQIETRIQRSIEAITPAQIVQLRKIHLSIKDSMSTTSDWFESAEIASAKGGESVDPFAGAKKQKGATSNSNKAESKAANPAAATTLDI